MGWRMFVLIVNPLSVAYGATSPEGEGFKLNRSLTGWGKYYKKDNAVGVQN